MAWSGDFLAELEAEKRAPVYIVQALSVHESDGWDFGKAWNACSHAGYGYPAIVGNVRFAGPRLNLATWTSTLGGASVQLTKWSNAADTLRRGYIIVIRMGFSGWSEGEFQTVALGRLRNFRVRDGGAELDIDGAESVFVTRQSNASGGNQLFGGVSRKTTVDSLNYEPGLTPGDIRVVSTTNFEKQTGGLGAIRVTPNAGDDFYLTWSGTGTSPTRFILDSDTGRFGTTSDDADIGNEVFEVGYLNGHPFDIIRKLLVSTGEGTNGTFDKYPKTWGLGIPSAYLNTSDSNVWEARHATGTGTNVDVDILVEATESPDGDRLGGVPDGLAWLRSKFGRIGVFPAFRQGQFTVRCALPATLDELATYASSYTITNSDVNKVLEFRPWDSSIRNVIYRRYGFTDGTNGAYIARSQAPHLPMNDRADVDVSDFVFKTSGDMANIASLWSNTVGAWAYSMPGSLSLSVTRWAAAQTCIGDVVKVNIEWGGIRLDDVPGVVTRVDPFNGAGASLTVAFPEDVITSTVTQVT